MSQHVSARKATRVLLEVIGWCCTCCDELELITRCERDAATARAAWILDLQQVYHT